MFFIYAKDPLFLQSLLITKTSKEHEGAFYTPDSNTPMLLRWRLFGFCTSWCTGWLHRMVHRMVAQDGCTLSLLAI